MIRQQLDEYLDGGLSAEAQAAVEERVVADASAARLLERLRAERALRAEVYASYEPTEAEARAVASRVMAACAEEGARPAGRIGMWVRRISAAAAVLVIAAGSFVMGRATAAGPTPASQNGEAVASQAPVEVIRVLYNDDAGDPQMKEFASMDEANSFSREMWSQHHESVVVASNSGGGTFDPDHAGSF